MSQISLPLGAKVLKLAKISKYKQQDRKSFFAQSFWQEKLNRNPILWPFRVTRNIKKNFQYPKSNSTFDSNKNKSLSRSKRQSNIKFDFFNRKEKLFLINISKKLFCFIKIEKKILRNRFWMWLGGSVHAPLSPKLIFDLNKHL